MPDTIIEMPASPNAKAKAKEIMSKTKTNEYMMWMVKFALLLLYVVGLAFVILNDPRRNLNQRDLNSDRSSPVGGSVGHASSGHEDSAARPGNDAAKFFGPLQNEVLRAYNVLDHLDLDELRKTIVSKGGYFIGTIEHGEFNRDSQFDAADVKAPFFGVLQGDVMHAFGVKSSEDVQENDVIDDAIVSSGGKFFDNVRFKGQNYYLESRTCEVTGSVGNGAPTAKFFGPMQDQLCDAYRVSSSDDLNACQKAIGSIDGYFIVKITRASAGAALTFNRKEIHVNKKHPIYVVKHGGEWRAFQFEGKIPSECGVHWGKVKFEGKEIKRVERPVLK